MRLRDKQLTFSPVCPNKWCHYRFSIRQKACRLSIKVTPTETTYELLEGRDINFEHNGEKVVLAKGELIELKNKKEASP
jgi:trehalose/maltose hydrolase-like predicted phosphorylase